MVKKTYTSPQKKIDARSLAAVCGKQLFLIHMLDEIGRLGTLEKHLIIQVILLSSHDAQALAAVCSKWGKKNIYPPSPPQKKVSDARSLAWSP